MELRIVLDFDGVLFHSAFEAYSVSNETVAGRDGYRQDVPFDEFLEFRAYVTDAWQYNRLYRIDRLCSNFEDLPGLKPDAEDWQFSESFFVRRAAMMADPEWAKVMSPYDFFFLLKPLLIAHREKFCILSTRNVESIRRTMDFFGADVVDVFGQEDIRRLGSKIAVAQAQGWLDDGRFLVVYIDDMNAHLEPFEGKVHLPLHANWGYDKEHTESFSQHQVLAIVGSMLKLVKDDR